MFAQVANRYVSGIYVKKGSMKVNAKSTMGVMMLAAGKGTQLTLIVDGADEAEAIEALIALVESGFNEV
jgi:phosphotransferase system HPr (HPr) family protein